MKDAELMLLRATLKDHVAAVRAARSILRDHYPHSRIPEELTLVIEYLNAQRDATFSPVAQAASPAVEGTAS